MLALPKPLESKRFALTLLTLVLALSLPFGRSMAQERQAPEERPRVPMYDPGQPIERKVLKNGVRLLVQEQRTSEKVAGVVALRMGTRYETEDESGIGQIVMRTITAGTTKRNPAQMRLEVLALGGEAEKGNPGKTLESSAGPDMGQISIATNREGASKAVDLLADVVQNPAFPDTAFEAARSFYLGKASDELESPIPATYAIFLRTFYRGTPFERPAYGRLHSISECRRADVVALYRKLFVGGNITVAFVGNFDGKKMMADLEKAFGTLPPGAPPAAPKAQLAPLASDTTVTEERPFFAQSLAFGFPAPGYDDPDYPAFLVIDSYLRSGDRSPISYWLPERHIATGVGVLYPRYPGKSSIAVYLGARPEQWKAARDTVANVMGRLRKDPLEKGDWSVHLRRAQSGYFRDQTNPLVRARDISRYETQGLSQDFPKQFETKLLKLTPEDVRAAAERWFTHSCEVTLIPTQSGSRQ